MIFILVVMLFTQKRQILWTHIIKRQNGQGCEVSIIIAVCLSISPDLHLRTKCCKNAYYVRMFFVVRSKISTSEVQKLRTSNFKKLMYKILNNRSVKHYMSLSNLSRNNTHILHLKITPRGQTSFQQNATRKKFKVSFDFCRSLTKSSTWLPPSRRTCTGASVCCNRITTSG